MAAGAHQLSLPLGDPGRLPPPGLSVPSYLAEDDEDDTRRRPRISRQWNTVGRGKAIDPWPFADIPDHPGYGLTPQRVLRVFRESEAGCLRELADLYDDLIESDAHLRAAFESRIKSVSGKEIQIHAGADDEASKAAADALENALDDLELGLVNNIEHLLEAPFKGWSATEIEWGMRDGLWVPVAFDDVSHRRFNFNPRTGEILLSMPGNLAGGDSLWQDKWIVSRARHSNLARAGLFRTATWWALFKRLSMRDWIVFAERFGIPHAIGYYQDEATEEARTALEQALKDLGEGGHAVLHELTKIVFADVSQRSGDTSSVHPAILDRCDAEISKLISGATLISQTGGPGSFALGRVHADRAFSLELADAAHLQRVWRRFVAKPFVQFNGFTDAGAKPPRLVIRKFQEIDPKDLMEIAAQLNDRGVAIDGRAMADLVGLRIATDDANALRPPAVKAMPGGPDAQ